MRWSGAILGSMWFFAALVGRAQAPPAAAGLDPKEFHRIQALLEPDLTEPWRTIPWKISLLAAQRTAVKEAKPIFIWAMDGHPLGCT
jgi:hypothetical protein